MALADESNRIVQEFDFSDEELNTHVKEFLRQMGMLTPRST
jgi:hexokinase